MKRLREILGFGNKPKVMQRQSGQTGVSPLRDARTIEEKMRVAHENALERLGTYLKATNQSNKIVEQIRSGTPKIEIFFERGRFAEHVNTLSMAGYKPSENFEREFMEKGNINYKFDKGIIVFEKRK